MSVIKYFDVQVDLKKETISVCGVVYEASVAGQISEAYERMCTASYLMDTYSFDEKKAWEMADKVRSRMADYDITEGEAIDEIMDGR